MTTQPNARGNSTDAIAARDPFGPGRRAEGGRGALLLGKVVNGRYRVLDTLGAGSLGIVYLCEEIPTNRKAALKVFRRDVSRDDEFMRRLRRQVTLASTIGGNHASVVAALACGQTDDGNAFIATEYLQGRSLRDVIRRGGPLEIQRALRLACQIAEGLDAIHGAGYVHGDVRPENVIVVLARNEEVAKLKGFEVAGLRDTALVDHLVRAGVISSNAEYLAPERVEGDRATVRTDIYAFGIVLYEMLTGRVPFVGTSPDGVMAKHLQELPAPLSVFRRGVPSVLDVRVKQALEKEPERRQRYVVDVANEYLCELSADEMLAELSQEKRGVIGKVASTVERAPLATGLTIGAIAALVAAAAVWVAWLFSPLPEWLSVNLPWSRQRVGVRAGAPIESAVRAPQTVAPLAPARDTPSPPGVVAPPARVAGEDGEARKRDAVPPRVSEVVPSVPSALDESSLRPPGARERPEGIPRLVDQTQTPPPSGRKVPAEQGAPPPSRPQRESPAPTRGAPDPDAIIDWLLKQSSGRQ